MNIFSWDLETFLITPGCQAPPPVVFSCRINSASPEIIHVRDPAFRRTLLWALESKDVLMVAHAAAFEAVVTLAYEPQWTSLLFDKVRAGMYQCTAVRAKCIRVARGDGDQADALDACCDYFGVPHQLNKDNPWRLRFGELIDVPVAQWPDEPKQYALEDTIVDELWLEQEHQATPEQLIDQHNQMRYDIALRLTSCRGFMADPVAARQLMTETEVTLEEHKQTLIKNAMLLPKREKGVLGWRRPKEPAEQELIRAYAAMGREPPRGQLTPVMLRKAYTESGLEVPPKVLALGKKDKVKPSDLDEAYERGAREDLLLGNYKLDEEACLNSGSPKLLAYCRYGTADTLRGKVGRLVRAGEAGKPVQGGYNVLVATGRTSSFQGEDPAPGEPWRSYGMQMQNLPRAGEEYEDDDGKKHNKAGARECFVARPGWAIVSVDYDACEMRTWAQVCYWLFKYSDLRDILNNPKRCPHVEMGARLRNIADLRAGLTWDQMYAAAYALKGTDKKAYKDLRGLAKGPNFGLPGGMAWARLMDYCRLNYGVVLSPAEAQNAVKVWGEIYREALPYLDWVKDQVGRKYGSRGTITQFVSKRQRGRTGYTDASNGYFQGLAADIAKCAGWRLVEQAYEVKSSALYGCRPLAFVHDEWLYEVPIDRIHEAGHLMAKIMVDTAMNDYCPDVLFTASPAAMLRWSKASGDPVYWPDKRLAVYEHWLESQKKAA